MLIGSQAYLGVILKLKGNVLELSLNKPCVYYKNEKVAISRNVNNRWRLSGMEKLNKVLIDTTVLIYMYESNETYLSL